MADITTIINDMLDKIETDPKNYAVQTVTIPAGDEKEVNITGI